MSIVTLARCQIWLAQSSLSEGCHRTLRCLPVVPGHIFQSAVPKWTRSDSGLPACIGARLRPQGRWVSCCLVPATLIHLLVQVHSRGPLTIPGIMISTGGLSPGHFFTMSVVRDPAKSLTLSRELASLLDKDTIEPVEWHTQLNGFYSVYFSIP